MATQRAPANYEEEDEEEELLQRALAEQAAREAVSTFRPSPARSPIRTQNPPTKAAPPNRAPPPASNNTSTTTGPGPPQRVPPGPLPPKRAPPQPLPVEEDDDEELLSLSSEDDAPPAKAPSQAGRRALPTVAAANIATNGRDEDWDEEEEDDEEEPSTWKPSYKAELERRVRELRETRGASATSQMQRARSIVDPVLSRGDEFVDPLGLGVLNARSLTLIPKISRSEDNSPAVSTASSDAGSAPAIASRRSRRWSRPAPVTAETRTALVVASPPKSGSSTSDGSRSILV